MIQGAQFVAPSPSQNPRSYQGARKVVRMDGTNQRLDVSMDLSGAKTMVVVGRLASSAASTYMITGGTGPSFNLYIGSSGKFAAYAGNSLTSTLAGDTNTHTFIVVSNGASSVLSVDGTEVAGNIGTSTVTGLRLASTSTAYAAADFQRVAILPYAATAAQRAAILAQMRTQYNTA